MITKSEYNNTINAPTYGESHLDEVEVLSNYLVLDLHPIKEATYKGSWARRGHIGIFFTMVRPLDRIESICNDLMTKGNFDQLFTRTFFDALMDTALYCLKWAAVIAHTEDDILQSWLVENGIKSNRKEDTND